MKKNTTLLISIIILLCLLCFNGFNLIEPKIIKSFDKEHGLNDSLSGNYLAGYYAFRNNDIANSSKLFAKTLQQAPDIGDIIDNNYVINLLAGNIDQSLSIIRKHRLNSNNVGNVVFAIEAVKQQNYAEVVKLLAGANTDHKGYVDKAITPLLLGWSYFALNQQDLALETIRHIDNSPTSYNLLDRYSLAKIERVLFYDLSNQYEQAAQNYQEIIENNPSFVACLLAGNFFERNKNYDQAKKIYQIYHQKNPLRLLFTKDLERIAKGEYLTERYIATPQAGIIFLLSEIANMLSENKIFIYSLIYSQLANYIDQSNDFSCLSLADYYNLNSNLEKALIYERKITITSPFYLQTKLNIASNLYKTNQNDEAIKIFTDLIKNHSYYLEPYLIYADLLREDKKYQEAIKIYDQIIANFHKAEPYQWHFYYMRSMNYNLAHDLQHAEDDLVIAHKLNPSQETVMNDLAYGWLTEGKNLDQAFSLLETAIEQSPHNPAIIDSMGFALYTVKKYEEALNYLQKASEIMPDDPIVSTHLGDNYWRLGKKIVARFEWQHALDNCTDPIEKAMLEKKLAEGLPK